MGLCLVFLLSGPSRSISGIKIVECVSVYQMFAVCTKFFVSVYHDDETATIRAA